MTDKSKLILDLTKAYNDHRCSDYRESLKAVLDMLESDNKEEPTDEEVIRYCNKHGYIICTLGPYNRSLREKPRIEFAGYVGVDGKIIHPE